MIKNALAWLKTNVVVFAAGVICVIALLVLLIVHARGNGFVTSMKDREKVVAKIQQLMSTQVTIPAEDIDKPPRIEKITVNQTAINALSKVYDDMKEQYENVFDIAVQQNMAGHYLLLEGLLPDPGQDVYKRYDARIKYLKAFEEMMDRYSPNPLYPRLNARGPLSGEARADQLMQATEAFLNELLPRREEAQLSIAQQAALKAKREARWLDALRNHARECHVYAGADFAFQIGDWARKADLPNLHDIWESQLNLWIQQDIIEAIGRTNRVEDPNYFVSIAPVKRLMRIEIIPGYVGINSAGGLTGNSEGMGVPTSGEVKLPDDFTKSPTGRRSNTIYDVRHVKVDVIVDVQRLPEFFDNLMRVNFMTVLHMEVRDVDEYAAMNDGYMYGTGDAAHVSMLIETIWLRNWTKNYMPLNVRQMLGITEPATEGTSGT